METRYPMRLVVKTTGLSPHVIRVWEKRYGALSPGRSPTNRRLFSESEIARLSSLAKLTRYGHNISQLAPLSDEELTALERRLPTPSTGTGTEKPIEATRSPEDYVALCLERISRWDSAGLEATLNQASLDFSPQILIESIVSRLLEEIGRRWEEGEFRVVHEHLASAVVRSFLGSLRSAYPEAMEGPLLVVATPAGQVHELGALLAAKTAAMAGFQVLYLGANVPADELAAVVKQRKARLLALSLLYPAEESQLLEEMTRLALLLPPGFPWVCGGRAAPLYRDSLAKLGCQVLPQLADFRRWLREWRDQAREVKP